MVALLCCLIAYMPIRQAQRVKTTLTGKHSVKVKHVLYKICKCEKIFKNVHRSLKLDIICLMFFYLFSHIKHYKTIIQNNVIVNKILKMYEHLLNKMYTSSAACN